MDGDNGAIGRRWDDVFCQPCFCRSSGTGRCATPSGLAIGGDANPGCADVSRPWATVCNAFGVEEPASVSEIPTYAGRS